MSDPLTQFLQLVELRYATDRAYRRRLLGEGERTVKETLAKVRAAA